ncbi:MAG TPA: glycoside hydrolase family protein [Alphaproteobacteria bacterium]|nr:glycoside hydrolase family protein [Alphaproteobacteria bacterium]
MDHARMLEQLVAHEGVRLKPYRCPAGKLTIGIGRNLDDVGLTRGEAFMLASNDIVRTEALLEKLAVWGALGDVRQRVLCDMAFNMGVAGLMQFRKMFAAIEAQDFARAADEMLASAWAKQVPGRADKLARMMRTGHDV